MKCCICSSEISGYGNNPWSIENSGECCDLCNMTVILKARLEKLNKKEG